jgi:hypothetical protein
MRDRQSAQPKRRTFKQSTFQTFGVKRAVKLLRRLSETRPYSFCSHPQHETLARMRNRGYGWGGLLGLDLGSLDAANKLLDYLQNHSQFGLMAVSLGYHVKLTISTLSVTY